MNPLVSVIVPAFNEEQCINDCLLSIEQQDYTNIEIIVLDDGSTDGTADICRAHAKKDSRITFLHFDERRGQGSRRNYGMKLAKGGFIAFVDADDMIRNDMFQILLGEIQDHNADIIVCKQQTHADFIKQPETHVRILDGKTATKCFLMDPGFGAFSWNKIFRKEILKETGEYPEDQFYEDVVFIPQVCANAKKIIYTDQSFYFYRQHSTSVTGSRFSDMKMDQVEAYNRLVPKLTQKFPDLSSLIYEKAFFAVMGVFNNMKADGYRKKEYSDLLLKAAREYRRNFTFAESSNRKRTLIFSLALIFPHLYGVIVRCFYRKLIHV